MPKKPKRPGSRKPKTDLVPRKRQAFIAPAELVDINDVELLSHFITEYGKIIPARVSGVTALQQRHIKKGIRRARNMGLLA